MTPNTEPVRLGGWTALAVGAVLQAIILWSSGTPPEAIAGALASMLLVSIGGLEWARRQAWSPVSHFREVEAATTMTVYESDEEATVDLRAILMVLLIAIALVVLARML